MKQKLKTRIEKGVNTGTRCIRHDAYIKYPYIYDLDNKCIEMGGNFRWFNFYGLDCSADASDEENKIIGDE